MALKSKPTGVSKVSERQIEKVIEKGGSVGGSVKEDPDRSLKVLLRYVDSEMPGRIDKARHKRRIPPSINTWLNEAILEKLEREEA